MIAKIHLSRGQVKLSGNDGLVTETWRCNYSSINDITTVDGSEIRRENQLRVVVYPIIYEVLAPSQVVNAGFLNHQQYVVSSNHQLVQF